MLQLYILCMCLPVNAHTTNLHMQEQHKQLQLHCITKQKLQTLWLSPCKMHMPVCQLQLCMKLVKVEHACSKIKLNIRHYITSITLSTTNVTASTTPCRGKVRCTDRSKVGGSVGAIPPPKDCVSNPPSHVQCS